jgi:hypothetical protein
VVVDAFVVVGLLGTVVVELLNDVCEDVDVDEVTGGKERDVLLLGTLQNCCASDSAVVSSEGHPLVIQSTIFLVKRLLRYHHDPQSRNRFHDPNNPRT